MDSFIAREADLLARLKRDAEGLARATSLARMEAALLPVVLENIGERSALHTSIIEELGAQASVRCGDCMLLRDLTVLGIL